MAKTSQKNTVDEPADKRKMIKVPAKTRSKKLKTPLKRSTLGMEFEFFILNENGEVVSDVDRLLKKIEEKKKEALKDIVHEASFNLVEVGSYPSVGGVDTMKSMIENLKLLLYTADELNLVICPLGTYPGVAKTTIRPVKKFNAYMKLIGTQRYSQTGRIAGFHFHYALPWGVFDRRKKELKKLINSKNKESLVHAHNFLIAADPALSTLLQSSPFYQGKYVAKDTRSLIWRAWDEDFYSNSVYGNFPEFAALSPYKHTSTDIVNSIDKKYETWMNLLKNEAMLTPNKIPKYKSKFETNWSPVRINGHGTIEQRGMDMNHFTLIGSVSLMLSRILKAIQEDYYKVESSDIAIKEPFKLEKKTIFIPPDTHVRNTLQKASVMLGVENEEVWYYCKRLLSLCKLIEGKKIDGLLEPIEKIIKDKKTLSDQIIEEAKKLGHTDLKKPLSKEIATQIALEHSKTLFKETVLMQQFLEEIEK